MIAAVLLLMMLLAVGLILRRPHRPPSHQPPPDPDHLQRAAVELHRIRRQREGAEVRHQQRRGAAQVKREIAEVLESER